MALQVDTAVRLKADSSLLYVDAIDHENVVAFCRRFGASGPEGEAEPYPLDALRENVSRASRQSDVFNELGPLGRLLCGCGLHRWQTRQVTNRGPLGSITSRFCIRCGDARPLG